MAALTDNKEVHEKHQRLIQTPVAAAVVVYKGAIVMGNASGYLAPMVPAVNITFAGIAAEKADNATGANGDVEADHFRTGLFKLSGTGFTQADLGKTVYASDDQTVSTTQGTNEVSVGKIAQVVSATEVYVDIALA